MDNTTIFIAVTAAAVVLQMLILLGMFLVTRKLTGHLMDLSDELESRVLPLLQDGKRLMTDTHQLLDSTRPKLDLILDNASVISTTARSETEKLQTSLNAFMDKARLHAIRADELLTRTMDRVEETGSKVEHTVMSPIKHLNGILQGIGVGLEAFFNKANRPRNGRPRDEMFV
jgi:hypothetical protein